MVREPQYGIGDFERSQWGLGPIRPEIDLNPEGRGQYQGSGGSQGHTRAQNEARWADLQDDPLWRQQQFMNRHPRFADRMGWGEGRVSGQFAQGGTSMPSPEPRDGRPPLVDPRDMRDVRDAFSPRQERDGRGRGRDTLTSGTMEGSASFNDTPGAEQGQGGDGGQGAGQGGGKGPASSLTFTPEAEAVRRSLDDELSRELAGIGVARGQIPAMQALIESRLRSDMDEELRQTDEAANARGVYHSGIRTTGRGRVTKGFDRKRQDLASDIARQYADLASRESAAYGNFNRSWVDALLELARGRAESGDYVGRSGGGGGGSKDSGGSKGGGKGAGKKRGRNRKPNKAKKGGR